MVDDLQISFNFWLVDLLDRPSRQAILRDLAESKDQLLSSLNGASLQPAVLTSFLLSLESDENDNQELSLEELEGLSGGFGLTDALISSSILMMMVSQSSNLFAQSMNALSRGNLRDGVNAAINSDVELVRHEVASWATSPQNSQDGQLAYAPSIEACTSGTLGQALLADKSTTLPASKVLDLSKAPASLKGISITRTIKTPADNPNMIQVSYKTSTGASVQTSQNTTLATPAQGWCP